MKVGFDGKDDFDVYLILIWSSVMKKLSMVLQHISEPIVFRHI